MIRLTDLSLQTTAGLSMSCFVAMAKKYNSLINYDWSTTTTSGLRYLKDVGSTPTYNASMYFGRGAYLNGVDQSISMDFNIDATVKHSYLFNITPLTASSSIAFTCQLDGIYTLFSAGLEKLQIKTRTPDLTITVTDIDTSMYSNYSLLIVASQTYTEVFINNISKLILNSTNIIGTTYNYNLGARVGTVNPWKGIIKDNYIFSRELTTAEKDSYINTPELFYVMAQADSTCVLNMPMCETDGYVRNMKSYSKGVERTQNVNITTAEYLVNSGETTVTDNALRIYSSAGTWSSAINNNVLLPNTEAYYLIEFNVSIITIQGNIKFTQNGTANEIIITPGLGKNLVVLKTSNVTYDDLTIGRVSGAVDVTISSISVKQLSGIYPITSYTASVRNNAKNLQYGLQTCKFVRDSLGVIQSASNYLECDGVGYGNTGWVVDTTKDFTIEFTKYVDHRNDASDWITQESGLYSKLRISTSKYLGGWLQVSVDNNLTQINISTMQGTFVSIVIVVVAGDNFKVYVNKVIKTPTDLVNTVVDTQGFRLGSGLTWNINGVLRNFEKNPITKFKVHNKALTNEEIQAL